MGPLMMELRRRAMVENGSLVSSPASLAIDAELDARDMRLRRSARDIDDELLGEESSEAGESARRFAAEPVFLAGWLGLEDAAAPPLPTPNTSSTDPDVGLRAPPPDLPVVSFASLKTSSKGLKDAMARACGRGARVRRAESAQIKISFGGG